AFVVDHVEGAEPLGRRREGIQVEKSRAVRLIHVDRHIVNAERTVDAGHRENSADTDRGLDLGWAFSARREKRACLLACGLRIAVELLSAELDEPRARKHPALVEPAPHVRRKIIGGVAHGVPPFWGNIRERRSLRRGPFPAIYLP